MEQMTEYNSKGKMKMSQWMRTIPQGVTAEVGCSTFRDYHNKKNVAYYTGRLDGVRYSCKWNEKKGVMHITNLGARESKEASL